MSGSLGEQLNLTDLHSHILPGVDDGARDLEAALALLKLQKQAGVTSIALTPHFNCEKITIADFLSRRLASARVLAQAVKEQKFSFRIKMGAELYFSPTLPQLDLAPLCLQGTPFLLIELPVTYQPNWVRDVFYDLQAQGYVPLLAHVERYPYMLSNPDRLYELVNAGVLVQVNAGSLLRDAKMAKQICQLIRWNLVHVIASDTHSVHRRPPQLAPAFQLLQQKLGADTVRLLQSNAQLIFGGELPESAEPYCPRRLFGEVYV